MNGYHISDLRFIWCGAVSVEGESSSRRRESESCESFAGENSLPGRDRSPNLVFAIPCKVNAPLNGSGMWVVTYERDGQKSEENIFSEHSLSQSGLHLANAG